MPHPLGRLVGISASAVSVDSLVVGGTPLSAMGASAVDKMAVVDMAWDRAAMGTNADDAPKVAPKIATVKEIFMVLWLLPGFGMVTKRRKIVEAAKQQKDNIDKSTQRVGWKKGATTWNTTNNQIRSKLNFAKNACFFCNTVCVASRWHRYGRHRYE